MPDYCREIAIKAYRVTFRENCPFFHYKRSPLSRWAFWERKTRSCYISRQALFERAFLIIVNIIIVPSHHVNIFKNNKSLKSF